MTETQERPISTTPGWLQRLGLHRRELRAWALYDWANSAVWTTVIAAVFPIYFAKVASAGLPPSTATARFAAATALGLLVVACIGPILGSLADRGGTRKRMLAGCIAIGAAATAGLFGIGQGDWIAALVLFVVIEVGVSGSIVFYDALLPHVARHDEIDRVSTTGYALGYLGGGILLALNLAWIQYPGWFGLPSGPNLSAAQSTLPTRIAFLSVAAWWIAFSVPLFLRVKEPAKTVRGPFPTAAGPLRTAWTQLRQVIQGLRGYRNATLMLVAFLIYSDGIGTIIRMAALYGNEVGIGSGTLIGCLLLVQFLGIPFAILFGRLSNVVGTKGAIFIGLAGYASIAIFGYFLRTATHFLILSVMVAMVQGGTQALSRSLFASLVPKQRSAEFFGLFATAERFAGLIGPAFFALMITLTGSSRYAVISVIVFFIVGAALLLRVDVAAGQHAARESESEPSPVPLPGPMPGTAV